MGFWTTPRFSWLDMVVIFAISSIVQAIVKFWF